MEIIIIIVIVMMIIANQVEKNKKNNSKIGATGAQNIVPQPNNAYHVKQPNIRNSEKAFNESSAYQTSRMMKEQRENRTTVTDTLTELNISQDKNKDKKANKINNIGAKPVVNNEEPILEYIDLDKPAKQTFSNDIDCAWSVFDDFAASDALYLARKDVERRKNQEFFNI